MAVAAQRAHDSHTQLLQFAVEGRDFVKQFDQTAISAFGSFENEFSGFILGTKTAKEAFSDMAQSILSDLTKMILRMAITAPIAQAIAGAFGVPAAPISLPRTFATGGFTGRGGKYQPAGIVHAGEFVVRKESVDRIGVPALNRLNGYADGGMVSRSPWPSGSQAAPAPVLNVEVRNYGSSNVQTREENDGRGGRKSVIVIDEMTSGPAGRPGSRTARAAAGANQLVYR